MMCVRAVSVFSFIALLITDVSGEGFLQPDDRARVDHDAAFQQAMASVMGCGSANSGQEHLLAVELSLTPIWRTVPKNVHGRVDWKMLRYVAHRYFLQTSSLLIRGLEPAKRVNETHMGNAQILNDRVPTLVESVLDGKQSSSGFTLEDATALVATMEQLMFDSESKYLEAVYKMQRKSMTAVLDHQDLFNVIESYMVRWMVGDDDKTHAYLMRNRTLLEQVLPHWNAISDFANGMIKSMEYSRQRSAEPGHGLVAMTQKYSFDDAHEAVGKITKSFASFWETECQTIKASLLAFDKSGTGRVRLSDFYGANSDGEWRFGESEEYLRELGALDESSPWLGKQVIVPNYIQGASNCIVSTPYYFVCCVNECESVLNEIEETTGAPVGEPDEILHVLATLTNFDDEPLKLAGALTTQLQRIADTHGGKVPLHGRLFAQWLHYVFPRECPFPHKSGTSTFSAPLEFGENYLASTQDVASHAASRDSSVRSEQEEAQWMSQWSEEEELIADYSQLRAPWEGGRAGMLVAGGVLLALFGGVSMAAGKDSKSVESSFGYQGKAHFV